MSDASAQLRAAADCIDDARTDLEYGDLDVDAEDTEEIEAIVEEVDGVLGDLIGTVRQTALLAEVEEADPDE